ncbi:MAG TPA: hypothetical protein ACQGQI_02940 [Xylella sp.]
MSMMLLDPMADAFEAMEHPVAALSGLLNPGGVRPVFYRGVLCQRAGFCMSVAFTGEYR